ncbi:DUF664 domain-containing protein [Nonomuraea sp. PA05]|uniref:mycothiol transferase n=1 Tax=Nonomuraea sp. PA05 TaxID=2604466 RepID=UPI0021CCA1E0|nr:DUF664 domain-containing protein [Nonomuraea sp. PA05]
MALPTKLVVVVRADLPHGWAVNAAAVLGLSLGRRLAGPPPQDDKDASGGVHAGLDPHPVPVLSATAEQLRELHDKAGGREDVVTVGFNEVARQARDYDDYRAALAATPGEGIEYVAIAVFGPRNRVTALTKHLPLHASPPPSPSAAAGRRGDLFPAPGDRRFTGPATGDERRLLLEMLSYQRETLRLKCSGLHTDVARRAVEPSTLSLLGLVRHLADVERRWFRCVLAGQQAPPLFSSEADPDGDFDGAVPDPEVIEAAWRAWVGEVAFAEEFVAGAAHLGVEGHDAWRGTVSLRWVLMHLIEEYARHNGHADLLRERIDGTIGL